MFIFFIPLHVRSQPSYTFFKFTFNSCYGIPSYLEFLN